MGQAYASSVPGIVGRVLLMMLVVPVHLQARGDDASPTAPDVLELGRDLFTHRWMPGDPRSRGGDGLGPVFNAQSCLDCHDRGGTGGAGHSARNIDIASVLGQDGSSGTGFFYAFSMNMGPNRFEYRIGNPPDAAGNANRRAAPPPANLAALEAIHPGFRESPSVVLHRFGTDPNYANWRAEVPGRHGPVTVRVTQRNPTALFGVGLIDALPDEVLEDAARRSRRSKATQGRLARTADGRIGRFGWKGQTASLEEFVRSAAAGELGLEVPGHHQAADPRLPGIGASGLDLNQDDLNALVAFVRSLPRPTSTVDDDLASRIEAGAKTFRAIGCTSCHVPDLGPIEGIYSDLLLHDMGPRLVDTGSYIAFGARPTAAAAPAALADADAPATEHEWRTPPLWGLADSGPYLHDGRAQTISEAILLHDGQGAAAARRFAQLSSQRKEQLGAFLLSLTAPIEADPAQPDRIRPFAGIGTDHSALDDLQD